MWRNMIPENPNCIDMKRSFLRDKDSRLNKIIMRGGLTSSSSSTAQLYENKEKANQLSSQIKLNYYRTSTSPLDMQAKKLIKPGDMVTVNIGGVPFISGLNSSGNERQSAYANQNPKQDIRDNLISPKMMRSNNKKSNAEKGAKPSSAQPDFIYLENESSFSKSNSFGVNKDKLKSRNKQRRCLREFNQENKKRSLSKGSRIEGKLNEEEMLPIAQDLTEEELNKYKLM